MLPILISMLLLHGVVSYQEGVKHPFSGQPATPISKPAQDAGEGLC